MPFNKINMICFQLIVILIFIIIQSRLCEGRSITVDDDGPSDYSTIQDAINASNDGDHIEVNKGYYYENVQINKAISLSGAGIEKTFIIGNGENDTISIISNQSTVNGFRIIGSDEDNKSVSISCILAMGNNISISNNSCMNASVGIRLKDCNNNDVFNNICSINLCTGIWVYKSDYNDLEQNIFTNSLTGIEFEKSNCNVIQNNMIQFNAENGMKLDWSSDNQILNNIISNNGENGTITWRADNTIFSNNNISVNRIGIWTQGSSNMIIENNAIITNTLFGIYSVDNLPVYASSNYWGSDSGPWHPINNPDGMGDNISGQAVIFSPWLDKEGNAHYLDDESDPPDFIMISAIASVIAIVIIITVSRMKRSKH